MTSLKREFKPHALNFSTHTSLNKPNTCAEVKQKLASLTKDLEEKHADVNILNSKSTGQIPSKYSSFTDYNKNKSNQSSSKIDSFTLEKKDNAICLRKNKSFVSTMAKDWRADFVQEDLLAYESLPYEYNANYLGFNCFNESSNSTGGTSNDSHSPSSIEKTSSTALGLQRCLDKNQCLNDYLIELTNYYKKFNNLSISNKNDTNLII